MHSIITRTASLVLAFGLFFGCSLIKPATQNESLSSPIGSRSTQAIEKQLESLDEALLSTPSNADAYSRKGHLLYELATRQPEADKKSALYNRMSQALRHAQKRYLRSNNAIGLRQTRALLQKAWSREYDEGIKLVQNRKTDNLQKTEEALQHFHNATIILPDSLVAYKKQAELLYAMGDYNQAINTLESARRNSSEISATLLEQLGFLYLQTEQHWKAIRVYEKANTAGNTTNITHGLANAHIAAGNHVKAIQLLSSLIKKEPDNAYYLQTKGKELYLLGKKQLQNYFNTLKRDGSESDSYLNQAKSSFNQAEQTFDDALRIAPNNIDLRTLAAGIYQNIAVDYQRLFPYVSSAQKEELKVTISHYLTTAIPLLRELAENHDTQYWANLYQAYTYLGMNNKAQNAHTKIN